jgi:hypothetical protein
MVGALSPGNSCRPHCGPKLTALGGLVESGRGDTALVRGMALCRLARVQWSRVRPQRCKAGSGDGSGRTRIQPARPLPPTQSRLSSGGTQSSKLTGYSSQVLRSARPGVQTPRSAWSVITSNTEHQYPFGLRCKGAQIDGYRVLAMSAGVGQPGVSHGERHPALTGLSFRAHPGARRGSAIRDDPTVFAAALDVAVAGSPSGLARHAAGTGGISARCCLR